MRGRVFAGKRSRTLANKPKLADRFAKPRKIPDASLALNPVSATQAAGGDSMPPIFINYFNEITILGKAAGRPFSVECACRATAFWLKAAIFSTSGAMESLFPVTREH